MKRMLLVVLFTAGSFAMKAQQQYFGFTADYNSGIGERYTYGLGMHMEMRVWNCENLYFNWHYTIGSNTHSEVYAHAGLPVLLYKSRDWWETPVNDLGGLIGLVIGPACCPSGVTWYMPVRNKCKGDRYRFGIYCDPLALDCWQMDPHKVTSWTIDSGVKCIISTRTDLCIYLSGGVKFTNNIRRGAHGYGNETLIGLQVGLVRAGD